MQLRRFMKANIRQEAIRLRKMNMSYSSLSKKLGVSKGTLSLWFKDDYQSSLIKEKLTSESLSRNRENLKRMNGIRKAHLEKLYKNAENEALKEFSAFKNDPLFIAGLSLYWGEGDKVFENGQVRISNIDWKLLDAFRLFLEKICDVPENKIHGHILLYPDLNPVRCLNFWSSHVNLPKQNFFKSVVIKGRTGSGRSTAYGIGIVQVCNKVLKKKILKWVELVSDFLRD